MLAERYRGLGIAEALFDRVKNQAIEEGKKHLFLLTTTASEYFARLGFQIIDRSEVPDEVKYTAQFSSICPTSAVVMVLSL